MPDTLTETLAALERFEGSIPWMYNDTAGKVTVGVGLMLPDAVAAAHLPFAIAGRLHPRRSKRSSRALKRCRWVGPPCSTAGKAGRS
jgi:GH24 family phage-related lysozyme (muramidase)